MLLTVNEFCTRVRRDMPALVDQLQDETGRSTPEEEMAWSRSLPEVAGILDHEGLQDLHVHLRDRSALSLEYRLPAASGWCDLVLLGRGDETPAAVLFELKNWDISATKPGPRESIVLHHSKELLHPSEQVRGYVEYVESFHSAVLDRKAKIAGCSLMTNSKDASVLIVAPYDRLQKTYPVFSMGARDIKTRLPEFLKGFIREADEKWAHEFQEGQYKQDRSFVRMVASAVSDPACREFVLIDGQRRGYELCHAEIGRLVTEAPDEKLVIIIEGPPGSGKSVLAAKLWASLNHDHRLEGNHVIVTTSTCQRTNWESLVVRAAGVARARGVVKKSADFGPGFSTQWVVDQRNHGDEILVHDWQNNLELATSLGRRAPLANNSIAVSIVDEAHALIDPTAPGLKGVSASGWTLHAGPQAYHIVRASKVSVFLMDPAQSYRDNESTTPTSLIEYATLAGATRFKRIILDDAQFRCGGSKEYVDWLSAFLANKPITPQFAPKTWRKNGKGEGNFEFELVADPGALDERLREKIALGKTVRLLASYAVKWSTKGVGDPHALAEHERDFVIDYERGNKKPRWSRIWNYVPEGKDYSVFIQAPVASRIHADPLSEVGCPYVVRGFDFDYVGMLWLPDLVWRKDRWVAQLEHAHESAWKLTLSKVKKARKSKDASSIAQTEANLLESVTRGYRILLTRAIRGAYVWCQDDETREKLKSVLGK